MRRERRQFGQLIGDFQMVQKLIADSATEIFGVKMMVMNAAWDIDQGRDATRQGLDDQGRGLRDAGPRR